MPSPIPNILAVLLVVIGTSVQAQTITVVDATTRAPLEAATLYHPASGAAAITDAKGRAPFAAFAGADSILFRMIGYQPRTLSAAQVAPWTTAWPWHRSPSRFRSSW